MKQLKTDFSVYGRLPASIKIDVDNCVATYYRNGEGAAEVKFRQIASAHNLARYDIAMLGDTIRTRLTQLGYLPVGSE